MGETTQQKYDLEERTAVFGENVLMLCKDVVQDTINRPLISQIVRSGTSIGANYMEANNASSKKDFRHKIYICKKEAQETKHWLRMLKASTQPNAAQMKALECECQELVLIFQKITQTLDGRKS